MRKAHEPAPCKCGRDIIDDTCEGCGLIYDDCDCEALENMNDLCQKET